MIFPETGYTPANLRSLLNQRRLTREDAARLLGVKVRAVHRWCADQSTPSHRDMSLQAFQTLLEIAMRDQTNWLQFPPTHLFGTRRNPMTSGVSHFNPVNLTSTSSSTKKAWPLQGG